MEISGGSKSREAWYRPAAPAGNRTSEAPIEVLIQSVNAGELKRIQTETLAPQMVGRKLVFGDDAASGYSDRLVLKLVRGVRGLSFRNAGDASLTIGGTPVAPGSTIAIDSAQALLDATKLADSPAWNDLVSDIVNAIHEREALDAGLVPT